jgi:AraC-like DNA-binding protein
LKQGEYLLCPKGVTVKFETVFEALVVHLPFTREMVEHFVQTLKRYGKTPVQNSVQEHRVCILHEEWSPSIGEELESIIAHYFECGTDRDFFIVDDVLRLMYHLFPNEHMRSKIRYMLDTSLYPEPVMKVESYMLENYYQPVRLQQLQAIALVSESQLNRLYKKCFGMTPMERLTSIRMEQAALLLRKPSITILEVAMQVGYQSTSAFVQQFKKRYTCSPKEFQTQNQGRHVYNASP